jgi:hypothetical protein
VTGDALLIPADDRPPRRGLCLCDGLTAPSAKEAMGCPAVATGYMDGRRVSVRYA